MSYWDTSRSRSYLWIFSITKYEQGLNCSREAKEDFYFNITQDIGQNFRKYFLSSVCIFAMKSEELFSSHNTNPRIMSNTTTFRGSTSRTHPKFSRIREFKDIDPWDWVDHRVYTPDTLRLGMVTVIDNDDCEIKVSNEDHYHSLQDFDHPFNCTGQISPIVVLRVEIKLKQSGTFQVMDVFAYKRIFRHDVIYKAINGSVSYDINTDAGRLCGTYSYLTWSFGDIYDQCEDYLGSRASFFENGFTNGRSITFDRVVLTPRPQSAHRAVRSVHLSTVIPDAPQVYYVIIGESPGWYFINEPITTRTARTIRDFNNEQRHQLAMKRLRLPRESMESAISGLLSG